MDNHAAESPEIVLGRLEASIEDALHRLIDGGRISDAHRESAEGFRHRLARLQAKMNAAREPVEIPPDAKTDFDLLAWDFKRWLAEIDKDFEDRAPAQGLGRGAPD